MSDEKFEIVRLELKYCEFCGGLWLRERGCQEVHCERCRVNLKALPFAESKAPKLRHVLYSDDGQADSMCFVCEEGGTA